MPKTFNGYHEPFVGGGALFFDVAEEIGKVANLADSIPDLAMAYRAVAANPMQLMETLRAMKKTEYAYYAVRAKKWPANCWMQRAARLIYLNKLGFNGLYRTNKSGGFNVPYGHAERELFDVETIMECSRALRSATLALAAPAVARDFRESCNYVGSGDFVYFDPPYVKMASTSFTAYDKGGFSLQDHVDLAEMATTLRKRGAYVMLSNSDNDWVRDLYKDFVISTVQARRNINSNASGRGKVTELIITGEDYK